MFGDDEDGDTVRGKSSGVGDTDYDELYPTPPDTALSDLNKCLLFLGLTSVDTSKLRKNKAYPEDLVEQVKAKTVSKLEKIAGQALPQFRELSNLESFDEILTQLIERFNGTEDKTVKLQVLSVLPVSWSLRKIEELFGASLSMVRTVKKLVSEHGIIPNPQARTRQGLPEELKVKVEEFYTDNSRMLPGKKDYVSVKEEGIRVQKQKMLVLLTLKELYALFNTKNPGQIGFSKFAELRPRQCILAGASGTHSVCVCIHHENFSLLLEALKFEKEEDGKTKPMTVGEVLRLALCHDPKPECYLGMCKDCPGAPPIQAAMEMYFDERIQSHVQFRKWTCVDRSSLETCVSTVEEFMENVTDSLPDVTRHHFIAKEQGKHLNDLKANLQPTECLITGDFSENYSPIIQDAIQGMHWSKDQITIHPFVCYYKPEGCTSPIVFNFVIISDYLEHNSLAVYAFQHKLLEALMKIIPNLLKVYYFSDGAASQYKNRQIALNLRMHFKDFKIVAEWHYCASCHGKGPCDGVGGRIKREARLESIRRVGREGIVTAKQLYEWSKEKFSGSMTVEFVSLEEMEAFKIKHLERFTDPPALDGIKSCHNIIPLSEKVLAMKEYSAASTCAYVYYGEPESPQFEDIHGFVIISGWYLAFVTGERSRKKGCQSCQIS